MMQGMPNDGNEDDGLTRLIIFYAFAVANGLGAGFLEDLYENALAYKLCQAALHINQQRAVKVRSKGQVVGTDVADLIVSSTVVVELEPDCLTLTHAGAQFRRANRIVNAGYWSTSNDHALKAVNTLITIHAAQGLNCLKASALPTCRLLNFGTPRLQVRRRSRPT